MMFLWFHILSQVCASLSSIHTPGQFGVFDRTSIVTVACLGHPVLFFWHFQKKEKVATSLKHISREIFILI